ncbi:ABC transporter substrate-binding protein [Cohnella mopanensis]|uniref:ABC transporter substrate-binding protein n=1 Tax=Cohnella mopanensis TaxID=2911966 RepID=UPI001EF8B9CB|nr:iron-siderophore ABC transporter substrate-binding protein [Cohnella mopanensis]
MLSAYVRHRSVLIFLAVVVSCFVLAGCGNKSAEQPSSSAPAETSSAAASSPQSSSQSESFRTIKDAYGDVQVPVNPIRIVALDIGALDNLLALGIKPVGAPSILAAGDPYPKYLPGTEGITNIGSVNEPNLEAIDALKPDLIIGNKDTHDQIHGMLVKLAPTVFVETLGITWKDNLLLHADTVGKSEEGRKLLDDYQSRIEQLKAKFGEKPVGEISLIRPREDKVQVYLQETFAGGIMKEAGIVRPEVQRAEGFSLDITDEQIASLDGDVILWFSRSEKDFEKAASSPLWATLKAVELNKVYHVDWEYWMSGLGIQAVNKVVDDLSTFLIQQ